MKTLFVVCFAAILFSLSSIPAQNIPDLIEPSPKREAVDVKVPTPYEAVSDANLIVMSNAPNARIDIYRIGFIKRGRKSIEINGEVLGSTEPFVDCVAKPVVRNSKTNDGGNFEVKLEKGVYAIGILATDGTAGHSNTIVIEDKPVVVEVKAEPL